MTAPELIDEQTHDWFEWEGMTCCRKCAMVKRADGKNKPCRGKIFMRPFETPLGGKVS